MVYPRELALLSRAVLPPPASPSSTPAIATPPLPTLLGAPSAAQVDEIYSGVLPSWCILPSYGGMASLARWHDGAASWKAAMR
jgi:hypothetical protein